MFPQKIARVISVGGVALAAMGATTAFANGTSSTQLENGVLGFTAFNGVAIGSSSTKFYASDSYRKTGGGTVSVVFGLYTQKSDYTSGAKTVKKGQTVSHNFGAKPISDVPKCFAIGYMNSGGKSYETPSVRHLC
ncbi:hypothetical protein [Streptomyces rimosus]|uniref:hypothetical protein n=1 Tax=Streptomyces rimosus TaxID=1927 RepID=UPI000A7F5B01|nr:hypothetical protein [Streptomyces rimosus]